MTINELFRIDGQVALVTGGARHLGFVMASILAEAGAHVVVTSRDLAQAEAAAGRLRLAYPAVQSLGLELDHRSHAAVVTAVTAAAAWKGRIDILINNAGGGSGTSPSYLLDRSPADVVDMIHNNLVGALHCCQEVSRVMVPQKRGKIVNIASVAGLIGRDRRMYERHGMKGQPIDYAAAKAGVVGMTRDLASLLSPHGIQVNAISPGGFERDTLPEGFRREFADRTPAGRMGREGRDLQGAALFLAAPASDFVTGHNLVVDGGFSLWH